MPYFANDTDPNAQPPARQSRVTVSVGASPTRHESTGELDLTGKTPAEARKAVKEYKNTLKSRPPVELGDLRSMTPRQRKDAMAAYKRSMRRD